MGCYSSKRSRRIDPDNVTVDAELKVGIHSLKFAKQIRKEVCKLNGVAICETDIYNQKVLVAGNFDLEEVVKTLKKKTGKTTEVLKMTRKFDVITSEDDESDIVEKEDDKVPEKNEESEMVPEKEESEEIKEIDDKPERRDAVFKIRSLCDKYEVHIRKVIVKFEGVENCMVDVANKRVVVTGNFDQEKLLEKLQKKMRKIIKKEEELKIAAEKDAELEMYRRNMHARLNSEDEKEMAKFTMFSEGNPNGCTIS